MNFVNYLNQNPQVKHLILKIKKTLPAISDVYLVGGAVRDLILKRKVTDIDITLKQNLKKFAKKFARCIKSPFIILRQTPSEQVYRTIYKNFTIDFSRLKGRNIYEDLKNRDFTINSLAVSLENLNIIDINNSLEDLKNRVIKINDKKLFVDDPLRILRMFRFMCELNFNIEKETFTSAKKYVSLIKNVSSERIHEELVKIFTQDCSNTLWKMNEVRLFDVLIPELAKSRNTAKCYYTKEGVLGHTFKVVEKFEWLLKNLNVFGKYAKKINDYLKKENLYLLKFGAFFHDIGKYPTAKKIDGRLRFFAHETVGSEIFKNVANRLRFSSKEIDCITKLIKNHMRPLTLAQTTKLTDRAIFRYYNSLGEVGIGLLLIAISDHLSYGVKFSKKDKYISTILKLLYSYYQKKEVVKPKRLITGYDLLALGIPEGPIIGRILDKVEELSATGKIKTKKESLKFAKNFFRGARVVRV